MFAEQFGLAAWGNMGKPCFVCKGGDEFIAAGGEVGGDPALGRDEGRQNQQSIGG